MGQCKAHEEAPRAPNLGEIGSRRDYPSRGTDFGASHGS